MILIVAFESSHWYTKVKNNDVSITIGIKV
jgi:(2Fe-2S) ferredoxin